jgi:hypothetical protein
MPTGRGGQGRASWVRHASSNTAAPLACGHSLQDSRPSTSPVADGHGGTNGAHPPQRLQVCSRAPPAQPTQIRGRPGGGMDWTPDAAAVTWYSGVLGAPGRACRSKRAARGGAEGAQGRAGEGDSTGACMREGSCAAHQGRALTGQLGQDELQPTKQGDEHPHAVKAGVRGDALVDARATRDVPAAAAQGRACAPQPPLGAQHCQCTRVGRTGSCIACVRVFRAHGAALVATQGAA